VNQLKTLDLRTGSADELLRDIRQTEANVAKMKANVPKELHGQIDDYVSSMVRQKTDAIIGGSHRLPSNIDELLTESGKHGYSLSPDTIAGSQLTPDGKRALAESGKKLEKASNALADAQKMGNRISELRSEIGSTREAALRAANRADAAEPLARLDALIKELGAIATDLRTKAGNPADK
jgi:hypothetical protein